MLPYLRKLSVPVLLLLFLSASVLVHGSPAPGADICSELSFPPANDGPPPSIKPAGQSVRVLAFGDFGDGGDKQMAVAKAMQKLHQDQPFDFGITLGDNFYPAGLNSPTRPEWKSHWEKPYGPLGFRIYASLGNHDYYDPASPIAEALYSQLSPSKTWCLPRAYYTFTAGPVQFFVLDTDSIVRADPKPPTLQREWLTQQIKSSKSPWKVVYGHHPIYSTGKYGDTSAMVKYILPYLKENKVDVYIAGHDHNMQHLKPEGGVHFFISGAGGRPPYPLGCDPLERRVWADGKTSGFSVLEADSQSLTVSFYDTNSSQLHKVTLTK